MSTGPPTVTVRRCAEQDWERLRDLRLRMLVDTPLAFLETVEQARAAPETEWRMRARRGAVGSASLLIVAEMPDSAWVGIMGCWVDRTDSALLVGVYVDPEFRGRAHGVTDALLDEVERWTQQEARRAVLRLLVHEDNGRARAYYRQAGFHETGHTEPYPLAPASLEVEMAKQLDGRDSAQCRVQ